jgi:hypothetical protein
MTRPAHPPAALTTLLDALEAELLAAPTEEVRDTLRLTARARDAACQEVRWLLNEGARRPRRVLPEPGLTTCATSRYDPIWACTGTEADAPFRDQTFERGNEGRNRLAARDRTGCRRDNSSTG